MFVICRQAAFMEWFDFRGLQMLAFPPFSFFFLLAPIDCRQGIARHRERSRAGAALGPADGRVVPALDFFFFFFPSLFPVLCPSSAFPRGRSGRRRWIPLGMERPFQARVSESRPLPLPFSRSVPDAFIFADIQSRHFQATAQ